MTKVFNEGQHTGEFIISEGNGNISRDAKTFAAGQSVKDGTIVTLNESDELVALTGEQLTDGGLAETVAGIIIGDWDSTTEGTGAAIRGVPYIARLAEVNGELLTFPEETTSGGEEQDVRDALAALNIVVR